MSSGVPVVVLRVECQRSRVSRPYTGSSFQIRSINKWALRYFLAWSQLAVKTCIAVHQSMHTASNRQPTMLASYRLLKMWHDDDVRGRTCEPWQPRSRTAAFCTPWNRFSSIGGNPARTTLQQHENQATETMISVYHEHRSISNAIFTFFTML